MAPSISSSAPGESTLHYRGDGRRGRQSAAGATLVPDGAVVYDPRQRDDRTLGAAVDGARHPRRAQRGRPLASGLLLAPGGKDDGRLEVREIFGLDLTAQLAAMKEFPHPFAWAALGLTGVGR